MTLRRLACAGLVAALCHAGAAWAEPAPPATIDTAASSLAPESRVRTGEVPVLALSLSLDRPVPYRVALIDGPPRLVVDLSGAAVPTSAISEGAQLAAMRWGQGQPGWARLIVDLPGPMSVTSAGLTGLAPAGGAEHAPPTGGATLTIHLTPVSAEAFNPRRDPMTVLRGLPQPPAASGGSAVTVQGRPVRVVIDPGHGGGDPGAQVGAISEAAVMLGFATDLASALRAAGADPVLTRSDDRFIALEQRTTIARASGAALFLSLHADALPAGQAAGATVYVWNPDSNDRAAQQLAVRHDRTDMLAGMDLADTDEAVTRALIDLARTDTQPRSEAFAAHLTSQLGRSGVAMHRVPVRGAAFSVLKSPDIPSVLLELGFLTDPADRANLFDPAWRAAVAAGIARAVTEWAADDASRSALRRR